MRQRRKPFVIAILLAVGLLAVAVLSRPGRERLARVFTFATGAQPESAAASLAGSDVEQRARVRHGWSAAVSNSVVTGSVTFYNPDGSQASHASLTIYRSYPDRLRVEIARGSTVQAMGHNALGAWQSGSSTLTQEQARDIRAWLRLWPERLFVTRGGGAVYNEAGRRIESIRPGRLGQPPTTIDPPAVLEQVQMEDEIGLPSTPSRVGDRRLITYYINSANSTIESARWLEPDDPRLSAEDARAAKLDVRVDFSDWRTVDGMLWPHEVIRSRGGKLDMRIEVSEVRLNQVLPDTVFQSL